MPRKIPKKSSRAVRIPVEVEINYHVLDPLPPDPAYVNRLLTDLESLCDLPPDARRDPDIVEIRLKAIERMVQRLRKALSQAPPPIPPGGVTLTDLRQLGIDLLNTEGYAGNARRKLAALEKRFPGGG